MQSYKNGIDATGPGVNVLILKVPINVCMLLGTELKKKTPRKRCFDNVTRKKHCVHISVTTRSPPDGLTFIEDFHNCLTDINEYSDYSTRDLEMLSDDTRAIM